MAGSPLGQKALQWLDVMALDIMQEIADAALPDTTVTLPPNMWANTQALTKVDQREQAVYQRGRLDLAREIRYRIFGGEA